MFVCLFVFFSFHDEFVVILKINYTRCFNVKVSSGAETLDVISNKDYK